MRQALRFTVLALLLAVVGFAFVWVDQASADPAVTTESNINFTLNNLCTPEFDNVNITGSAKTVVHIHPGELGTFNFTAHGQGTDANGLKYNFISNSHTEFHDPLPQSFHVKFRHISQTDADNLEIDFAIYVNEQGEPTKIDPSDLECKG
jgi:hypothetical protein